ncbi:MAG TPA: ATP cone domain-containing protein [Candidatus Nanoarchaeia archaeon]|nr:ATP cone domain-containing protein [Candidatus Nanoarchaeia archaeon]
MDVIKRNRKRQRFSATKLRRSIDGAARRGSVKASQRSVIVREISTGIMGRLRGRRTVRSTELRRMVLGRLERKSRAAAAAWRRSERKKK